MQDYTGKTIGTIIIQRLATFEDYCKYKPHRVKQIGTASGKAQFVYKSPAYRGRRYWLWLCVACKRTGIIRADVVKRWTENGHQCRCRSTGKPPKPYVYVGVDKYCPRCCRTLPATKTFWYIAKRGYLSSLCKRCSRIYSIEHYKYRHAQNDCRRNEGGGFIDEP